MINPISWHSMTIEPINELELFRIKAGLVGLAGD